MKSCKTIGPALQPSVVLMKSCKTIGPALQPYGPLRSRLAAFKTVGRLSNGPGFTLGSNIYRTRYAKLIIKNI